MSKYQLLIVLLISTSFYACKKSQEIGNGAVNPQIPVSTTFQGKGGIYFLGSSDIAVANSAYTNSNLAGVVVRFKWENLETSPGVYNWAFIDGELAKAKQNNKKISIQVLGYPGWVINTLGASSYSYIDKNTFHTTYLDTLKDVITWDNIYLDRVKNLISKFAEKYAADTTVAYFNLIGGQISRGLPDSVITASGTKAFWTVFPYNADTVYSKMKPILDLYMTKFPKTPLWCSVDYVSFESKASGRANNYLCTQFVNYGVTNYPDRFGCWREDISACNPQPNVQSTSQWYTMAQNNTRTGAQMLWSVQDGPDRMNKCGILPNTKQVVLDSSIKNGLRLGMRYFEVYGADIQDASLATYFVTYHSLLKSKYAY
ncbi:MAG: hypothetical protein NTW29_20720 [Bacteroidetes bacterium]|nr:hypothetical protein [Bacteroidota bacterium]